MSVILLKDHLLQYRKITTSVFFPQSDFAIMSTKNHIRGPIFRFKKFKIM